MRVVVAGPYPLMPGAAADDGLALVRALLAAGHDVVTVSPEPSAAHTHLDPGGARGAARLALLARGADRLVLRLDATSMHADADPRAALAGRLALAAALRRVPDAEIRLDRVPARLTPQFVGLLLAPARQVVVGSDQERSALQQSGVATAKVTVAPGGNGRGGDEAPAPAEAPGAVPPEITALADSATAADVERALMALAERRRSARKRRAHPAEGAATLGLRLVPPLEAAPARSSKPGVAALKRLQRRVLGWQFDWTIQHVNRLHRATIDAIDALEREVTRAAQPGDGSDA